MAGCFQQLSNWVQSPSDEASTVDQLLSQINTRSAIVAVSGADRGVQLMCVQVFC